MFPSRDAGQPLATSEPDLGADYESGSRGTSSAASLIPPALTTEHLAAPEESEFGAEDNLLVALTTGDRKAFQQGKRKKGVELRAIVEQNRYNGYRTRRHGLITVSLFTLLSLHRSEHRLLVSASSVAREALLLLFLNQLVDHTATLCSQLLDSDVKHESSGAAKVPAIYHGVELAPSAETLAAQPAHSSGKSPFHEVSVSVPGLQPSTGPTLQPLESAVLMPSPSHHRGEHWITSHQDFLAPSIRRAIKHMREMAKHYQQAVGLQDSPAATRLVRTLDSYVIFVRPEVAAAQKKPRLGGRLGESTPLAGDHLNPLIFNPQPAKRLVVAYGRLMAENVQEKIHEVLDSAPHIVQDKAVAAATHPQLSLLDTVSLEVLEAVQCETAIRQHIRTRGQTTIAELAERLAHLPASLVEAILRSAAQPEAGAPAGPPLPSTPDVPAVKVIHEDYESPPYSAPPLGPEGKYLDVPGAGDDLGILWTDDESDSVDLSLAFQSASVKAEEAPPDASSLESSSPGDDEGEDRGTPDSTEPPADTPQPPTMTGANAEVAGRVLEILPIHAILFWEALYGLLLAGSWNVRIEQVLKRTAEALDMSDFVYELLVAITCEIVAEGVSPAGETAAVAQGPSAEHSSSTLASVSTKALRLRHAKHLNRGRILKVTGVALGVGALSALTAGLAAPAFAAGIGALGIAGTSGFAAFLGSAGGSAALASLFGASSAGLSGWKFRRRLADIRVFEFIHIRSAFVSDAVAEFIAGQATAVKREVAAARPRREPAPKRKSKKPKAKVVDAPQRLSTSAEHIGGGDRRPPVRLTIGISGFLHKEDESTRAWSAIPLNLGSELFALKWEPHLLTTLGTMIVRMVGEQFASSAASLWIQMTMTAGTGIILWPVSLLQYAGQLDNTWVTCRERAQQAGTLLAGALSDPILVGNRPVTLIGYSMGARIISYTLRELYNMNELHRVQHAVLMGLPGSKNRDQWRKMRAAISGRLVNVYCTTDWILGFLYRWMEWEVSVAGLSPIDGVAGVENYDATGIVFSHNNYEKRIGQILDFINLNATGDRVIETPT